MPEFRINVGELHKGMDLSDDDCAIAVGMPGYADSIPKYKEFVLKLVALRNHIMTESTMLGNPLSARIIGSGIHINNDPEALKYHAHRADLAMKGMYRHARHLSVRVSRQVLDAETREQYDREKHLWQLREESMKRFNRQTAARMRGLGV